MKMKKVSVQEFLKKNPDFTPISASKLNLTIADVTNRIFYAGEKFVITKRERACCLLVPYEGERK